MFLCQPVYDSTKNFRNGKSNEEMHRALITHVQYDPVFYYIATVLLMRTDALLRLA